MQMNWRKIFLIEFAFYCFVLGDMSCMKYCPGGTYGSSSDTASQMHEGETWCAQCDCSAVGKISCRNKNLTLVPQIKDANVTILSLQCNQIDSIQKEVFNGLTSLGILRLDNNNISSIEQETFEGLTSLRTLSLRSNKIASITPGSFDRLQSLVHLNLEENNISDLPPKVFAKLNLKEGGLLLSHNSLTVLKPGVFDGLTLLHTLQLDFNRLTALEDGIFWDLKSLDTLKLSSNKIAFIGQETFAGLESLKELDLGSNEITSLPRGIFDKLKSLESLLLENNRITSIEQGAFDELRLLKTLGILNNRITRLGGYVFHELTSLTLLTLGNNPFEFIDEFSLPSAKGLNVISDNWRVCCIVRTFNVTCSLNNSIFSVVHYLQTDIVPYNAFSSCRDLMHNQVLRYAIWVLGILATGLNLSVFLWRVSSAARPRRNQIRGTDYRIGNFLVSNLALGDFFVGLYLLIIACIDFSLQGSYVLQDEKWRSSRFCNFTGFVGAFSAEFSVFILTIITVERYTKIANPLGGFNLRLSHITILVAISFVLAVCLAAAPLILNIENFKNFYGNSPVCLALPFTVDYPVPSNSSHEAYQQPAWEYSFLVFVVLNFISVMILTVCYVRIILIARESARRYRRTSDSNESPLRRSVMIIVGTDMACWIPVFCLAFINLPGYKLPPTVYAWLVVFVLPINAAINPMIYTFYTLEFRQRAQERWQTWRRLNFGFSRLSLGIPWMNRRPLAISPVPEESTEMRQVVTP